MTTTNSMFTAALLASSVCLAGAGPAASAADLDTRSGLRDAGVEPVSTAALAAGPARPGPGILPKAVFQAPEMDTVAFAANIHAALGARAVGYAFVIAKNGQLDRSGQGGYARVPFLNGGKPFTTFTDVNVYSVSKTITAIAMLQLLDKLGIDAFDPISEWLPPAWTPGLGFDASGITFFDLLTHRTGINQTIAELKIDDPTFAALSTNTYEGVRAIVEHGIYPQFAGAGAVGYGPYSYKNANYKLAALLIWRMALATGDLVDNAELSADANSAAGYQHYVRNHVLLPSGVDGFCNATGPASQQALAYDIDRYILPIQFAAGGSMGGSVWTCGPKNWWLSAMDLAAVAAHLRFGKLLSPASRALMNDLKMGWSVDSDEDEHEGRFFHRGLGKWTSNQRTLLMTAQHPSNPTHHNLYYSVTSHDRVQSCLMSLPDGIDATLVMNSAQRGSSSSACGVLANAYDDAL